MTLLGKAINDRLKEKRMNEERAKKLNELYWKQDDLYAQLVELIGDNEVTIFNIKKAFIDAGWIEPMSDDERKNLIASYAAVEFIKREFMTGQDWYERFKKESPTWSKSDVTAMSFERAYLKAAKKAGGIE